VPPLVKLVDQFGTHDQVPVVPSTSAVPNQTLCNPVDKTLLSPGVGGPIGTSYPANNLNAHLYCYDDNTGAIKPNANPGGYVVTNQFGTYNVTIKNATRLCLPSFKFDPTTQTPPPGGSVPPSMWTDPSLLQLNHFQCYSIAFTARQPPPTLQLQDQFGFYPGAGVSNPTELCAPVIKTVEDATGATVGPDSDINSDGLTGAHLLCFEVTTDVLPHSPSVFIGNQFTIPTLGAPPAPVSVTVAAQPSQLCLPSFKAPATTTGTAEVPFVVLLPLTGAVIGLAAWIVSRRRHVGVKS
jgi:hypothetical protein